MRANEFIVEIRNPNNPEKYEYTGVDFLREPHFRKNLVRRPDLYNGVYTEFMPMTVESAKPLIDKLAAIREELANLVPIGEQLYAVDYKLKYSVLLDRGYDSPKGKNIYYLFSIIAPTIHNEFVWPDEDRMRGNRDPAPRFEVNMCKIVYENS